MSVPPRFVTADDAVPSGGPRAWVERAMDRVPFVEKELLLLRHLVGPGAVCVDVGAAGGAHLLVLSRLVGSSGAVHGFEPRPPSYRFLTAACRWLRLRNVTVHPDALGAAAGSRSLRIPVVPTRAHFVDADATTEPGDDAFGKLPSRSLEVAVNRLDDVVARAGLDRVDLLKCDVEGAELDVFAGAAHTLAHHRPLVLCEVWAEHLRRYRRTPQDVFDHLTAAGYRAYRYRSGRLVPTPAPRDDEDDYLFVPVERDPPI